MKIVGLDIETTGVNINEGSVLELGAVLYNADKVDTIDSLINESKKITILVYHKVINNAQIEALNLNADLLKEIAKYADEIGPKSIESRSFINKIKDENNHQIWLVNNEYVSFIFGRWLIETDAIKFTNYGMETYPNREAFLKQFDSLMKRNDIDSLINLFKFCTKGITVAGKNVGQFDIPYLRNNIPYFNDVIKVKHRMIDPSIIYTVASDEFVPDLHSCIGRLGLKDHETKHRAVFDVLDVLYLIYFHFKKSKYKTYLAISIENGEVVDKVTGTTKEIETFKTKYSSSDNNYLIINELDLHKLAVVGRMETFKYDFEKSKKITTILKGK